MIPVRKLLDQLHCIRETGHGQWVSRCPAHADHSPSLAIRALEDDRVLVHCFAGCSAADVMAAVGLSLVDLFSEPLKSTGGALKRERYPFSAIDALRVLAREALVVALIAQSTTTGKPLNDTDAQRAVLAAARIHEALAAVGVTP